MKGLSRWAVPVIIVVIIAAVVFAAGRFADQPKIFARGTIELAPELLDKAAGIETLFVVLYDADSPAPLPYGAMRDVIRIADQSSLGDFILTPERVQVMRPGTPEPTNFRLKFRLDRDGQGGQDQLGDLVGEVERVAYGTENIKVSINKIVQ